MIFIFLFAFNQCWNEVREKFSEAGAEALQSGSVRLRNNGYNYLYTVQCTLYSVHCTAPMLHKVIWVRCNSDSHTITL